MTSLLLHKILNYILVITVFLLVIWFVYMRYNKGQDLEEKLAGSICAKLIYENISKNFQITNVVISRFNNLFLIDI